MASTPYIVSMQNDSTFWALLGRSKSDDADGGLKSGWYAASKTTQTASNDGQQIPQQDGGKLMTLGTTAGTFQIYCYQDADDKWDVKIEDDQGNVSNGPSDLKNNAEVQLQIDSGGNVTITAA